MDGLIVSDSFCDFLNIFFNLCFFGVIVGFGEIVLESKIWFWVPTTYLYFGCGNIIFYCHNFSGLLVLCFKRIKLEKSFSVFSKV